MLGFRKPTKQELLHVIGLCSLSGIAILGALTFFCEEYAHYLYGNAAVLWHENNDIIRRIEVICAIIGLIYLSYIWKLIYKKLKE